MIGSYNTYKNPALEFSKQISNNIFGLDDAFIHPSTVLKKNLLKLIHIMEFSDEAQTGNEPSLILVVPDVICQNCQTCKDLDICRDPSLISE